MSVEKVPAIEGGYPEGVYDEDLPLGFDDDYYYVKPPYAPLQRTPPRKFFVSEALPALSTSSVASSDFEPVKERVRTSSSGSSLSSSGSSEPEPAKRRARASSSASSDLSGTEPEKDKLRASSSASSESASSRISPTRRLKIRNNLKPSASHTSTQTTSASEEETGSEEYVTADLSEDESWQDGEVESDLFKGLEEEAEEFLIARALTESSPGRYADPL